MAEVFRRVHPEEYLTRFLEAGVRPDGRKLTSNRTISVNVNAISSAAGSALVKFGNTTVICGITAEYANPPLDREDEGWIVPNVDFPPVCAPQFRPGPPSKEAQTATAFIDDLLSGSLLIDRKSLCIIPGKLSWSLKVDVVCVSYDGNVTDALLLALSAAFKSARLPKVLDSDESEGIPPVDPQETVPIDVKSTPLSLSFGLFQGHVLTDPTKAEEDLCQTSCTVVCTGGSVIAQTVPSPAGTLAGGQATWNTTALLTCRKRAMERYEYLSGLVAKAVEAV